MDPCTTMGRDDISRSMGVPSLVPDELVPTHRCENEHRVGDIVFVQTDNSSPPPEEPPGPTVVSETRKPRAKRFRVALTFSGEKRTYVAQVASILAKRFSEAEVLYDKYHEAEFGRRDLSFYLPDLYHDQADLIVVVVCRDYEQKEWCGLEWDAIFDLLKKRKNDDVMLCRFDNATVKGLYSTAGFVDLDGKTPELTATRILERLALNEEKPKDYYLSARRIEAAPHQLDPESRPAWPMIVACLVYWLLGSVLPLATLAHGQSELLARAGPFRLYARVYSHLFLFPVICGILIVGLLIRPLSVLFRELRVPVGGVPDPIHTKKMRRWAILIFVSWLLATLLVAVGDFFGGNHAIWEIHPRVVEKNEILLQHFRAPIPEFREEFGRRIDQLIQYPENWSWARWGYAFGLIPQIGALLAVCYLTIILFLRAPLVPRADEGASEATRNLVLSLFVATFWLITRMAFLYEKDRLYFQPRNIGLDWINVLLFLNAYFFAPALVLKIQRPMSAALLSILGLGGGVALFCRLSLLYSGWLSRVLGRDCDEFNFLYLLFFLVLLILCFLGWINREATEFRRHHT